jgi:hypothetical protein
VYAGVAVNFNVEFSTSYAFKSWISEQYANGTPMEVYCVLATPIETSIGDSEIALFKKLYTNKPNTNIDNDDGAWMTVKYVADTKGYVDTNYLELANAILELEDKIGSGGGAENIVLYTEQTLTNEQKAQARANIGAISTAYMISVFGELKAALEESDIEGAVAVLDEAILDLSTLA